MKPKRALRRPPYNPGVGKLIQGKRGWDAKANTDDQRKGFRGWHERGYLPHRDSPGLTQFITYHVADAFPRALLGEWAALLKIEEDRERRKQLEAYLDKGRGECHLSQPDLATICDEAFRHFHGGRYNVKAWCLMPNHAHVLVEVTSVPMAKFVDGWKGYTGRVCNEILKRRGAFWADDYWDTYMRNEEQALRTVRYIENNPVKARLVKIAKDWPWSSARFRDEYGRLCLMPERGLSRPQEV